MNADEKQLNEITERIIGGAYTVGNSLGHGFLEKVYENALAHELKKTEFRAEQQKAIPVHYEDVVVGDYVADLLVEGAVLVEIKVAKAFEDAHLAQCLNYLKVTGLRVCLLTNFGTPRVEIRRLVNNF